MAVRAWARNVMWVCVDAGVWRLVMGGLLNVVKLEFEKGLIVMVRG